MALSLAPRALFFFLSAKALSASGDFLGVGFPACLTSFTSLAGAATFLVLGATTFLGAARKTLQNEKRNKQLKKQHKNIFKTTINVHEEITMKQRM